MEPINSDFAAPWLFKSGTHLNLAAPAWGSAFNFFQLIHCYGFPGEIISFVSEKIKMKTADFAQVLFLFQSEKPVRNLMSN